MRPFHRAAVSLPLAVSAVLPLAGPAAAAPGDETTGNSGRTFVESGLPITLGAVDDPDPTVDGVCAFPVVVDEVVNNEYSKQSPDGGSRISGRLVVSFTNTETGETVVRNISGPGRTTVDESGSVTIRNRGASAWPVFESTANDVLGPGLYVIHGSNVFVDFAPRTVTGHVENICQTLG